jgi:tRNA modification GTPase
MRDTIAALSSGSLPSGVAVIRVSGPDARSAAELFGGDLPPARRAALRNLFRPGDPVPLDQALVLWFPAPNSFTGEDCLELQVHGGRAVVAAVLECLTSQRIRLAEPGEFTRRALQNGRMDLTEVEALADLVSAETEQQRRQAMRGALDGLSVRCQYWRQQLVEVRAWIESAIDFVDEDDVDADASVARVIPQISRLISDIDSAMGDFRRGQLVRDGFRVAICGPPNAGKSSLMNRLAARDVSLVTSIAGTTRDAIDVSLDLGGLRVVLTDTAGIRNTEDAVEALGVGRAYERIAAADLVLWLNDANVAHDDVALPQISDERLWFVRTKIDLQNEAAKADRLGRGDQLAVSNVTGQGLSDLVDRLTEHVRRQLGGQEPALVTRARHRAALDDARAALAAAKSECVAGRLDLAGEYLRQTSLSLARLVGLVDVDDVLDVVFREFCIGK